MQINYNNNLENNKTYNKKPNFQKIELVKVRKSLFDKSDDLDLVDRAFDNIVNGLERQGKSRLGLFLVENGLISDKVCTFLEQPMYVDFLKQLSDNNLSMSWLKRIAEDSGLSVQGPLDKDYHSFYVCSGINKEMAKESINKSNWNHLHKLAAKEEMKFARKNEEEPNYRRAFIRLNQLLVKTLQDEIIGDSPVRNITIDDEKDFPKIWDYFA